MKVTIKSPRANKRKIVVPFSGEENFIVPKQGGFGQPDNEEWISVESKYANLTAPASNTPSPTDTTQTGEGLPTGSGGNTENPNYNTSSGGIGGASTSTNTGASSSPSGGSVDTTTITPELTNPVGTPSGTSGGSTSNESTTPPLLDTGITTPPRTLGESTTSGTSTSSGIIPRTPLGESTSTTSSQTTTFQQTQIPTFPDFSTLDCSALASQIASIESQISQGNFTAEVGTAYNNALATAKSISTTKCNIASPPVIIAPVPTSAIGGGFGGGVGGGGFGEPPADETNITEQTTTESGGMSWFWIVAILGGIYFLTKGSKQ